MPEPFVYLNGEFLPRSRATMDIEDRGTMFADGVYEVLRYYAGKPLAMRGHVERLEQSLASIEIDAGKHVAALPSVSDELVKRNGLAEARVYWQITRGVAPRNFSMPHVEPTVLVITYPDKPIDVTAPPATLTAILTPDQRWHHCNIKSLMLLPAVLALRKAQQAGVDLAIMHRGEVVTESTSANLFAIKDGALWTHPANQWILAGITRSILLDLARELHISVHEQALTTRQLQTCEELFISGTTTHVAAVTSVDGKPISSGTAGPVTRKLHHALLHYIQTQ